MNLSYADRNRNSENIQEEETWDGDCWIGIDA
jgi:hypothetical protein